MKKILLTIMMIALLTMSLSGCLQNESSRWDTAVRVWDTDHPDDSFDDRYFSITIAELGNAKLEYKDYALYVNDEPFCDCLTSLYLVDLTNDGCPEVCFCSCIGSGFITYEVTIYDLKNEDALYLIGDHMNYNYYLFLRDGVLCIKEISTIGNELTRTGAVVYESGEVSVAWDITPDPTFDRGAGYHS